MENKESNTDMSQYVTKEEFDKFMAKLDRLIDYLKNIKKIDSADK